jgi:hypothetical protein
MKHSSSRELYSYWDQRRGVRAAPERGDIEPSCIRKALGDTFILSDDPPAGHCFRLAGTRVCALFARELRGEAFPALWATSSRPAICDLLTIVANEMVGAVAAVSGRTMQGFVTDLELLLLPLRHRGQDGARMIGTLAPMSPPVWLGSGRLEGLVLGTLRHLGPVPSPSPRIAPPFAPSRHRPRFVIYQGGR